MMPFTELNQRLLSESLFWSTQLKTGGNSNKTPPNISRSHSFKRLYNFHYIIWKRFRTYNKLIPSQGDICFTASRNFIRNLTVCISKPRLFVGEWSGVGTVLDRKRHVSAYTTRLTLVLAF